VTRKGAVLVGVGMVSHFVTRGKPVTNPNDDEGEGGMTMMSSSAMKA